AGNVGRDMLLDPDRVHVEDLIESDRLENRDKHHRDQREDDASLDRGESSTLELASFHSRRQIPVSVEIGSKAEKHEDRGNAKTVVPAINLREKATHQRSNDGSDVYRRAENDETAGPSRFVFRRIKSAHLRRDIALQ